MSGRSRIIVAVVAALALGAAGWYWWASRRVELYGGVKPFMQKLQALQQATAAELASGQKLPEDFEPMEQLSQDTQDLFAVFRKDPREQDSRFGPLAVEMVRQANMLEHDWDNAPREQAQATFANFVKACNACHQQLSPGRPVVAP